ncbi:MAG: metallophosphoesterase [Planctomycetes bacterium]|nr:metallophosphoesterase [Planctomycetota bacterium]
MPNKTLIVGDIHGCWDAFQDLLGAAGIGDKDEVIAVGDIADRGPDSPKVLEFFRTRPGALCVRGNHERKHVLASRGESRLALSQHLTRHQLGTHTMMRWHGCPNSPASLIRSMRWSCTGASIRRFRWSIKTRGS